MCLLSPLFDRSGLSSFDTMLEGTPDDMTVVDAASLRRQVCKALVDNKTGKHIFCVAAKVSITDTVRNPLCTPHGLPSRILYCSGNLESPALFLFLLIRDSKIWSLAIEGRKSNYQVFKSPSVWDTNFTWLFRNF